MTTKKKTLSKREVNKTLGWEVSRAPIQLADGTPIESHVANTRVIDGQQQVLGVVGKGYKVIQNDEILALADSIRRKHKLKFSHAGVVGDGGKVYFQCEGESFSIGEGDEVTPYMLFMNAHDGSLACRMTPMTERMVCANQLGNFLQKHSSFVSIRHSGDVNHKLEEAGRLGAHYLAVCKDNRQAMLKMRRKPVTAKKIADYFRDLYMEQIREVDINPKSREEDLARNRADIAFLKFKKRFEDETPIAGASVWNMANAYTGWLQHDYRVGKDPEKSQQRRKHSSLFGILAQRSIHAFQVALNV